MRIAVLILGLLLGVTILTQSSIRDSGASTQNATPENQDPADVGVVASVSRSFLATGISFDKTLLVYTMVVEFADGGSAERSMDLVGRGLLGEEVGVATDECPGEDPLQPGDLKEVSAPQIGDRALAFAGTTGEEEDFQGQVAALLFREGRFVYLMLGAGIMLSPMDDLILVAERLLDEDRPNPQDGLTTMRSGGLWDRLPTLDEVPTGLAFDKEEEDAHLQDDKDCATTPAASPAA